MFIVNNLTSELFDNITFQVNPGEVIAIIGDNGIGKSSLAKVVAGYYQADELDTNINFQDVGLLTQNPYMQFIGNTVFDELTTYTLVQSRKTNDEIEQILSECPYKLDMQLDELSGGQAQHLLIFKELYSSKKLLILDETLSNLDNDLKYNVMEALKNSGKAVILITNNIIDTSLANKVYSLENKHLLEIEHCDIDTNILICNNPLSFEYKGYSFKEGINILQGKSGVGKSHLMSSIAFDEKYSNASYIPQYPFEMISTTNARQMFDSIPDESILKIIKLDKSKLDQKIVSLSTGELVKVLLLKSICSECRCDLILVDEAIEVLDSKSQKAAIQLIEKHFKTAIIITHNPSIFAGVCVNEVIINEAN